MFEYDEDNKRIANEIFDFARFVLWQNGKTFSDDDDACLEFVSAIVKYMKASA